MESEHEFKNSDETARTEGIFLLLLLRSIYLLNLLSILLGAGQFLPELLPMGSALLEFPLWQATHSPELMCSVSFRCEFGEKEKNAQSKCLPSQSSNYYV